jgi:DNA-binding response OmpR family regulator
MEGSMIGYGKRVLVVDDMETMRLLLTEVLEQQGFTVVQACDGLQALCEMQYRHFDVVVTDYHMPHLNGLDFIRQSQMAWPDIPVIIVSGTQENIDVMVRARGAYGWIRKPFDSSFLVNMVNSAVNLVTEEQVVLRDVRLEVEPRK